MSELLPPPSDLPSSMVNTPLLLIAKELADAAVALQGVQDALHRADLSCLTSSDMIKLQKLDIVEQTIRALSDIVARSSGDPALAAVKVEDHLGGCSLSSLADVLVGRPSNPSSSIELF